MNPSRDARLLDLLRDLPPLLPQFLRKRRVGLPVIDEILADLDLSRPLLFALVAVHEVGARYGRPNGGVTLAEMRASEPYTAIDRISDPLAELTSLHYLQPADTGILVLSPEARSSIDKLHFAATSYLSTLTPLPTEDLERLSTELEEAAAAVRANPSLGKEPGSVLRGRIYFARYLTGRSPMPRIEQAIFELWGARDDAHIRACREAEMEGPPFDLLAQVYGGIHSESALTDTVKQRQTPEDIEANLEWLAARDLLTRHGDDLHLTPEGVLLREDIERETDRVYFDGWLFTPDQVLWLRDALERLISRL